MSESIRVSGKTVNDAVMNAAIQLGTSSDHIEYRVIERESRGFLGIGAKDAVIEAKVKEESPEAEAAEIAEDAEQKEAAAREAAAKESAAKESAARKAGAREEAAEKAAAGNETEESSEESPERKLSGPKKEGPSASAEEEHERKHKGSDIRVLDDPSEAIGRAEGFLRDVYNSIGMDVSLSSSYDGECLNVSMEGDGMGLLIGKRGQTLDSLQYLTSLVVNKGKPYYVRVKLDTENYRERRKATLENLAKNIATKVKKTRQPVALEPMNPYERRIIHSALQNDPFVTTHSEGEEPDRKVVVTLKKDADLDALDRKYGERRGGYRGSRGNYRGGRGNYRSAGRRGRCGDSRKESYRKTESIDSYLRKDAENSGAENASGSGNQETGSDQSES